MDVESIRSEVAFRFSRSSGPGGQHAQKSSTRVEALFDVETTTGLSEPERRRVLTRLGPLVRAVAQAMEGDGVIVVTQKGERAQRPWRGPLRLRRAD